MSRTSWMAVGEIAIGSALLVSAVTWLIDVYDPGNSRWWIIGVFGAAASFLYGGWRRLAARD